MRQTLQIANILAFIFMIVLNGLANGLPLNGKTTGELSALYPNLFVPVGITFSIWGIIYLWLFAFIIYQGSDLVRSQKQDRSFLYDLEWWFVANALLNGLWILVWHFQMIGVSTFIMLGILGTLITIFLKLGIGKKTVSTTVKWFVHTPFSIYLGWISIATIANITTLLVDNGYTSGNISAINWTIAMIGVGSILTIFMLYWRNSIPYAFVTIWAFAGILLKQQGINTPIVGAAGIGMGMIAIVSLLRVKYWINT